MDLVAFQRLHLGYDGRVLKDDGILGPKTRWALALEELPAWRQRLVMAALRWEGLTELGGTNRGPEIDLWLSACGVPPGNPWCAAFVSAMLRSIGIECAEARAWELWKKFPEALQPLPGDIFAMTHPDGSHHCGIIIGWGDTSSDVATCEGNCQNAVRVGVRARDTLFFSSPSGYGCPVTESLPRLGGATV